ncbi:hypothetical protein AB0O64_12700 [Streptomyces sp. NPDC088341]|uniref:hypothetical protein n=1 Tax=Streptomyces sp. NPDC088341 TaxID=3154870 RepID=UPI0034261819
MNTSFTGDLEVIIAGRGPGFEGAAESLRYWRSELSESTDILLPSYCQATALAVGLLIADSDSLEPGNQFAKINANIGNLWNCCDHIVRKAGGFQSPELGGLKNTLRGIENMWFDRDVELLSSAVDPSVVLGMRLRDISGKADVRNAVAVDIARCAGWEISG